MVKLFFALLAAAQSGVRYIRAVLRAVTGLTAKAKTAPGSDMDADLESARATVKAVGTVRPAADGSFQGKTIHPNMVAAMVAKLVSIAITTLRAGLASLGAVIHTAPSADMGGSYRAITPMTADAEASPGNPTGFDSRATVSLTADPGTAPPTPMEGDLETTLSQMEATPGNGTPNAFSAAVRTLTTATATMTPGSPETARSVHDGAASLYARMHIWRGPTRDGTNLYIPQVHSYQREGNNIKIM